MRPSFSRSYGGILPSSLTTVLPIALVFSTCPPVLVWGTRRCASSLAAFLGSMGLVTSPEAARYHVSTLIGPGFTWSPTTRLPQDNHRLGSPTRLRPRIACLVRMGRFVRRQPLAIQSRHGGNGHSGTGISTGCASTTPVGLALAPDSPWED